MSRFFILFIGLCITFSGFAQLSVEGKSKEEARKMMDSLRQIRASEIERSANERLERYRQNNRIDTLTEINLNDCHLEELPQFVSGASSIKVLRIERNNIRKIPAFLSELDSLKRIYWRGGSLDKRPKIAKLPQVERIYMSNKEIPESKRFWLFGPREVKLPNFKKLKNLQYLELKNLGLRRIPEKPIKNNANIKELILDENAIVISNDGIRLPNSLRTLKLNKIGMQSIGTGLYGLIQLNELQLLENNLDSLPAGISKLKNLTKLSLYKNKLKKLPSDFFDIPNLLVVDLYYNELEVIPPSIENAKELEVLFLAHNRIYDIPGSIGKLSKLEKVYLQDNRLSVLPETFSQLTKIKVLRIGKNYFTYFPDFILDFKMLEELDLNKTDIEQIPASISSLQNLKLFTFQDTMVDFNNPENKDFLKAVYEIQQRGVVVKPEVDMSYLDAEGKQIDIGQ